MLAFKVNMISDFLFPACVFSLAFGTDTALSVCVAFELCPHIGWLFSYNYQRLEEQIDSWGLSDGMLTL